MPPDSLTRAEAVQIAKMAADEAVIQTFRTLGVDVTDQRALNELRDDLVYSRRLRRLTESSASKVWLVVIGMITVGAALFLWEAVKAALNGVGVD